MKGWVEALRVLGVGFFVGGSIVLGVVLGIWLDTVFDTHWLWIAGLILGIVVASWGVYLTLLPLLGKNDSKENS